MENKTTKVEVINPCLGYVNGYKTKFSDEQMDRLFPKYMQYFGEYREEAEDFGEAHTLACFRACYETFLEFPEEKEFEELSTETARRYELFHRVMMETWIKIAEEREKQQVKQKG